MQLILADFWFSGTSYHRAWQGGPGDFDSGDYSGAGPYRRGGPGDLPAGPRSGGVCFAANGQTAGRAATQAGGLSIHAFGDEAGFSQGIDIAAAQKAGCQERTPRQSSASAAAYSPAGGAAPGTLPCLPEPGDALPADADADRRRHSRKHPPRRDPVHDSPRLVSAVPPAGRAQGRRGLAGRPDRQPCCGLVELAALRTGCDHRANSLGVRFPPGLQVDGGRPRADVASLARNPLRLVRGDQSPSPASQSLVRRRNRLAGHGQDLVAAVLHDWRSDLLLDRSLSRQSALAQVFQTGIPGNSGNRFLGRLQRDSLHGQAEMHPAFASRHARGREVPAAGTLLATLRQETAPPAARRYASEQAQRTHRSGLRVETRAARRALAGTARPAVEGQERPAAVQTLAATPARIVYIPGSPGSSL